MAINRDTVDTACPTCLEEFKAGDAICLLPSGHNMHEACVRDWIQQCNTSKTPLTDPMTRMEIARQELLLRRNEALEKSLLENQKLREEIRRLTHEPSSTSATAPAPASTPPAPASTPTQIIKPISAKKFQSLLDYHSVFSSFKDKQRLTSQQIFQLANKYQVFRLNLLKDQDLWTRLTKQELLELASKDFAMANILVVAAMRLDGWQYGISLFDLREIIMRYDYYDQFDHRQHSISYSDIVTRLLEQLGQLNNYEYKLLLQFPNVALSWLTSTKIDKLVALNDASIGKDAIALALTYARSHWNLSTNNNLIIRLISESRIRERLSSACIVALLRNYKAIGDDILTPCMEQISLHGRVQLLLEPAILSPRQKEIIITSFTPNDLLQLDYADFSTIFTRLSPDAQINVVRNESPFVAKFTVIQILQFCLELADKSYFVYHYCNWLQNENCTASALVKFLSDNAPKLGFLSDEQIYITLINFNLLNRSYHSKRFASMDFHTFIVNELNQRFARVFLAHPELHYILEERTETCIKALRDRLEDQGHAPIAEPLAPADDVAVAASPATRPIQRDARSAAMFKNAGADIKKILVLPNSLDDVTVAASPQNKIQQQQMDEKLQKSPAEAARLNQQQQQPALTSTSATAPAPASTTTQIINPMSATELQSLLSDDILTLCDTLVALNDTSVGKDIIALALTDTNNLSNLDKNLVTRLISAPHIRERLSSTCIVMLLRNYPSIGGDILTLCMRQISTHNRIQLSLEPAILLPEQKEMIINSFTQKDLLQLEYADFSIIFARLPLNEQINVVSKESPFLAKFAVRQILQFCLELHNKSYFVYHYRNWLQNANCTANDLVKFLRNNASKLEFLSDEQIYETLEVLNRKYCMENITFESFHTFISDESNQRFAKVFFANPEWHNMLARSKRDAGSAAMFKDAGTDIKKILVLPDSLGKVKLLLEYRIDKIAQNKYPTKSLLISSDGERKILELQKLLRRVKKTIDAKQEQDVNSLNNLAKKIAAIESNERDSSNACLCKHPEWSGWFANSLLRPLQAALPAELAKKVTVYPDAMKDFLECKRIVDALLLAAQAQAQTPTSDVAPAPMLAPRDHPNP